MRQQDQESLDLHIILSKSETIFVVDCDIRINTPELRQGGTRVITNKIIKDHNRSLIHFRELRDLLNNQSPLTHQNPTVLIIFTSLMYLYCIFFTNFATCFERDTFLLAQFPIRIATSKEKESKTKSPLEYVLYSADFTIGDLGLSQACMGIWRGCAISIIGYWSFCRRGQIIN